VGAASRFDQLILDQVCRCQPAEVEPPKGETKPLGGSWNYTDCGPSAATGFRWKESPESEAGELTEKIRQRTDEVPTELVKRRGPSIRKPRRNLTNADIATIHQMRKDGSTHGAIAQHLGISLACVAQRLQKAPGAAGRASAMHGNGSSRESG
jgi:hypothetical protein